MEIDGKQYDLNNLYSSSDNGPYYVIVEPTDKDTRISAVKVGHYIFNNQTFKKDIINNKLIGRNKVKIIFKSYKVANSMVGHNLMVVNKLLAHIPTFFNHKKSIIREVDTFLNEKSY